MIVVTSVIVLMVLGKGIIKALQEKMVESSESEFVSSKSGMFIPNQKL